VLKKIDVDAVTATYPGVVLDGNQHDDMAEYLSVTDALITDYSGSVFDFALTGKPGFLYTPDKEHYIKDERGVYISLDELPYPHAVTAEALYELIEQYDPEASQKRIADFNEKVGNSEFGNAAEKVALCISKYLETNNKALALQELQF
jgi:CDP-glycerol glycerophosphotransferase